MLSQVAFQSLCYVMYALSLEFNHIERNRNTTFYVKILFNGSITQTKYLVNMFITRINILSIVTFTIIFLKYF